MAGEDQEAIAPDQLNIQLKNVKDGVFEAGDEGEEPEKPQTLKIYQRRWLILACVAILNNSNTMTWISFAPVSNYCNAVYGEGSAAWFSMVYMMMTIPVGLFSMWAGRHFGTKTALYIAGDARTTFAVNIVVIYLLPQRIDHYAAYREAIANVLGAAIRLSSSFLPITMAFPVGIFGQGIAAVAYPFIMYLPSKVANSWFPHNQRAIATTIGAMSNPLGVLLANTIAPAIVTEKEHILLLNVFVFVPALVGFILTIGSVRSGEPKVPPSFSASQTQMDFIPGLKQCLSSPQYLILFVVMGGGIGMFNCLYTIIQPLLCPYGYSNKFVGLCAALMILGGLVGATCSSIFVDKSKMYEETMKACLGLAVVFGLAFLQLSLREGFRVLISLCCFCFGMLGLASYPVGLELSVECTHPVSEATATGLIVLSGQVQSVIYVMIMKNFQANFTEIPKNQTCSLGELDRANTPVDSTVSVMIFSAIAVVLVLILVVFFKPVYRRLEAEKANRAVADKSAEAKKDGKGLPDQNDVVAPLNA